MPSATNGPVRRTRERRQCTKLVRYTHDEIRVVAERAQAAGRPIACYIREASLGTARRARHSPAADALVRQLAQLGNQLILLARYAAERELPRSAEFDAGLRGVLDAIRRLGELGAVP
jgi:hypothetical protein